MKDFNKDWEQYNFESVTPVISWPWNWVPKKKRNRSLNPECLSDPNICKQIFWSRARGDGLLRAVVKDRECEVPKGCCRLFSELHSLGLWTAIILMWLLQDQGKEKSIWGKKEEKKKKKDEKRWIQELCLHFYLRFTAFLLMGTSLAILASSAQHSACSLIQALLFVGKENIFLNKQREMDIKRMQAA